MLPERTRTYRSGLTDTTRWDGFVPRDDDVFVCTPPKSGTTWMQAICALVIFQRPELDFNPADRGMWLDAVFMPIDEVLAHFERQTERRVIKTHTPLDGIPFFERCTYITVYRDPRDAFFSMRNHLDNMKQDIAPEVRAMNDEDAFMHWLTAEADGSPNAFSVVTLTHHLSSYWRYRQLPNLHFFHYAEMLADLPGQMRRVAQALGVELEPALLPRLAEAASFANMKANAERFVPGAQDGFWHDAGRFLHKGQSGQFRDALSADALAAFDERLDALLGAELAAWLKHAQS